ncbi:MAG: creatininase family protein [Planctomycetota bacterium]
MQGTRIESLTWPEAEAALTRHRVVVLPLGAQLKEHGHHLPLNTDWLTAQYLADRLVAAAPVVMLPVLGVGHYPAFLEYPGSVSIGRETSTRMIVDIVRSLHAYAGNRFYVLNTGISTNWSLEPARQELLAAGILMDYTDLHAANTAVRDRLRTQPVGTHADELETSVLLAIHPEVVRMERAVPELAENRPGGLTRDVHATRGVITPTGAWGDPTAATREKGVELVESMLAHLVEAVSQLAADAYEPPPPRERYLA